MENKTNKAVKAGIGYTIGNVLVKGIGFLTVPIFSRLLTTEEFGVVNVFLSYGSILFVIIGLAIHSSIRSANIEFKGEIDRYTSSVSLVYIANLLLFLGIILIFGASLGTLLDFSKPILYMLILYSFGQAVLTLYNDRISLDYDYSQYLLIALINSLGNVGLSLLLILTIFQDSRDFGRILGSTIPVFVLSCILLLKLYQKSKPQFIKEYIIFALKYSLPIVPHGISQILLAQFDRIMIRSMIGDAAAGIYSLANNLKLILTIISDSIATAWSTWFYEEMEKANTKSIQKRAAQLCGFFCVLTIGLMAISPELILFLGGEKYIEGKYVAVPMIIDAFIVFIYNIIVVSEYYKKKTAFIMLGTMIAAVINVIMNIVFINLYGFIAAAYTTLFSYGCYLTLHMIISKKLVGFDVLELKYLFFYIGIITVCAFIDLKFSNFILIRCSISALIGIPLAIRLANDIGITQKYLHKER